MNVFDLSATRLAGRPVLYVPFDLRHPLIQERLLDMFELIELTQLENNHAYGHLDPSPPS